MIGDVIYQRQPDGRVLVDRETLATALGRPAGTIRRRCTPAAGELYDLQHAVGRLADLDRPDPADVALTAAEAQQWLGIAAGTIRSWASRGDLHPAGRRGASPTYRAAHLVELHTTRPGTTRRTA